MFFDTNKTSFLSSTINISLRARVAFRFAISDILYSFITVKLGKLEKLLGGWLVLKSENSREIVKLRFTKPNNKKKKKNKMKFERLLQIYWTRGFLYGGKTFKFNLKITDFSILFPGFNAFNTKLLRERFELANKANRFIFQHSFAQEKKEILNLYLAQLTSVNDSIFALQKLIVVRFFLTKLFRGRAQALGKPSRGQRTWSNAWTAFKKNTLLRNFISSVLKKKAPIRKKKINYKILQKKTSTNLQRIRLVKKRIFKAANWF
jgi:ribosomal protein S13